MKYILAGILIILMTSGIVHANLYANASSCNKFMGEVLDIVDNEVFTIAVCEDVKVFKEFSYCYEVEKGDSVIFNGDPGNCDFISFTVIGNGI
ncbi:MAG: hypothetical protein ABFR82_12980 [Nitrospirota bacterium]